MAVALSRVLLALSLVAAAVTAAGCGREEASGGAAGVEVVATTTHAADFVRNVGGERVGVRSLLRPGTDPHEFEPRPGDVRAVAEADLVVRSGGEVDEWLEDVLDNAPADVARLTLIDSVRAAGGAGDRGDPHWWQDPRNVEAAAGAIRDALARADPDGATGYRANAARYVRRLRQLDRGIAACMARVPARERKLVTTHDAFGHYARRYGIEQLGTVVSSLSSQAQASAGEVDRLVRRIRSEGVKAIFPESALNARLEKAIARESGAKVGPRLWADALGPEGSSGETYLEAMATNTEEMVRGFTGGRVTCRPPA
jgi:zinc/manganese transport system substrate-binding protein